jgi:biotin synthase
MLDRPEILQWLHEEDPQRLEELWRRADDTRRSHVGDQVHLRGLIEISNHCIRQCGYCGLRGPNTGLERYRMTAQEIIACAAQAIQFGYGTVVLQAGEDPGIQKDWVSDIIRQIKALRPSPLSAQRPSLATASESGGQGWPPPTEIPFASLAVTLSLGERTQEELAAWKAAGADRYLLRFETSNRELFHSIHPSLPGKASDRIALLHQLRRIGYEVGSGVMIGIPGQTYADLAADILLFAELDLDMIGVGPYLPHPQTPLGRRRFTTEDTEAAEKANSSETTTATARGTKEREETAKRTTASPGRASDNRQSVPMYIGINCQSGQVPNTELMTYKVIALARLACPDANIPSTTALATLNRESGRELGLQRGSNVVMPNLTPTRYRAMYEIYPAKACIYETAGQCHLCLTGRIASIGRTVGAGRGDSRRR